MKTYKSYKRVTGELRKVTKSYKKLQTSYRGHFRGRYSRIIEKIASLYKGYVGPTIKNMGDLIRTLCGHLTPTPKSRGDLIWILCAPLRPPHQRAGVISFGRYVATSAPHLRVQRSCHLEHMWPPAAPNAGEMSV